jgi:hypothetical protein
VVSSEVLTRTCLTDNGTIDCIAVWVDYDLTPVSINSTDLNNDRNIGMDNFVGNSANIHHQWDEINQDFPPHLKVNLKFFESPKTVYKDKTVLSTLTKFNVGDSDFKYEFKLD